MLTPPPFPLPLSTPILLNETAGHPLSPFRPWSTAIPHSPNHVHPPCRIVICQIILAPFRVFRRLAAAHPPPGSKFPPRNDPPHFNSPKFSRFSGQIQNQRILLFSKQALKSFSAFKFLVHFTCATRRCLSAAALTPCQRQPRRRRWTRR